MSAIRNTLAITITLLASIAGSAAYGETVHAGRTISERLKTFDRNTVWKPVEQIGLNFPTFHPQGMVKIGDIFYISSVEITKPTTKYDQPRDGYDRDTGEGKGHLFKVDAKGNLLAALALGEGTIYHPGGIDFDGTSIFVPVAEYRPNSAAIIYKVDPKTMTAQEAFRYKDHLGGVIHDIGNNTLNAVSWGSRRFYTFKLDDKGAVSNAGVDRMKLAKLNPSHYIDYQDCKYLGDSEMLCGGLTAYQMKKDGPKFSLGGLEIVNLAANEPVYQVPVQLWTDSGLPMTQNPFWIEPTDKGLKAYFIPEDDKSTIYIYEAQGK
jgi:hypothetical protein